MVRISLTFTAWNWSSFIWKEEHKNKHNWTLKQTQSHVISHRLGTDFSLQAAVMVILYITLYGLNLLSSINTGFSSASEQYKHCSVCIFVVKCLFVECLFFVPWKPVWEYCLLVTAKTNNKTGNTLTRKRFAFSFRKKWQERRNKQSSCCTNNIILRTNKIKTNKKKIPNANSM